MKRAYRILAAIGAGLAATAAPVSAQTTHTVELVGLEFVPADIEINLGDTVRWTWVSGFHNVESGTVDAGLATHDGNFRSGDPTSVAGTTFELVFDQAFLDANPMPDDVYPYYCIVHAGVDMIGSITVRTPGCTADADCDDADPCTDDTCSDGQCENTTIDGCQPCANNAECDDGNACNGLEQCTDGSCAPGTPPSCDDANPCTDDTCEPTSGCVSTPDDDNTCDDGNPCTTDTCTDGVCESEIIPDCTTCAAAEDCNDTNPCTDDTCTAGTCVFTDNEGPCNDGDPCTEDDTCTEGACTGDPVPDCCRTDDECDDDDPCTTDRCEENACTHTPVSGCASCTTDADCDDDNSCTNDRCDDGTCVFTNNIETCDDGDPCTRNDMCQGGACVGDPMPGCCQTDAECDDADPCTTDTCVNTLCRRTPIPDCDLGPSDDEPPADQPSPEDGDQDAGAPARPTLCGATSAAILLLTLLTLGASRLLRARPRDRRSAP